METEKLTLDMIRALRGEAGSAGDLELYNICDNLVNGKGCEYGYVLEAINSARAMDETKPFVRVTE